MRVQASIAIEADAAKVFDYVADIQRHVEWAVHPLQVQRTSEGSIGKGSTFSSVGKQFGTHKDSIVITEFEPARRVAFETTGDVGVLRHFFELTPAGSGTQLVKGFEYVSPSMTARLAAPLIKIAGPKNLTKDLRRIKARVEGSA